MQPTEETKAIRKSHTVSDLSNEEKSAIAKYRGFFIGRSSLWELLKFEAVSWLCLTWPGAAGYLLRKKLLPLIVGRVGNGVQWGRNLSLRHPCKITVGDGTVIDDGCLLDARGVESGRFTIGKNVLVARNTIIQAKTNEGFIDIGDHCSLGNNCTLTASGGIKMGRHVGIAGHCYIGGSRYETSDPNTPMLKQSMYSTGPIEIGDDCWIGAGVRILDGAKIGNGCVIGAGAVIRESVPNRTVVTPHQRLVMMRREIEGGEA